MHWLVRLGQRLPPSWRLFLAQSPLAPLLRRYFNRLIKEQMVIVELAPPLEGHRMRLDWQLYKPFVFGIYEPNVVTAIQQNLRPGMVAVDCGAHIGYHTLLMAKRVGKAGRVYAFEPLPENFSVLCENIRLNGYEGIVVAENKAVGAQTGRQRFRRVEHPDESHPFTPLSRLDLQGDLEVEVVALDDYFADRRVDFLKIDVEGAEVLVLKGMERIMCRDRPILLVELHAFVQWGENHPALQIIRDFNYAVAYLGRRGGEMHILGQPKE
jgi:FkbM family methyltransferase